MALFDANALMLSFSLVLQVFVAAFIYIYIGRLIGYRFGLFLFSFFRKSAIEWESASTVGFILLFQFASRFLKNYNFVSATRSAKKSRMCFSYSTLYIHSCTSILEEFFFEREI